MDDTRAPPEISIVDGAYQIQMDLCGGKEKQHIARQKKYRSLTAKFVHRAYREHFPKAKNNVGPKIFSLYEGLRQIQDESRNLVMAVARGRLHFSNARVFNRSRSRFDYRMYNCRAIKTVKAKIHGLDLVATKLGPSLVQESKFGLEQKTSIRKSTDPLEKLIHTCG